jgi:hypothetical protein
MKAGEGQIIKVKDRYFFITNNQVDMIIKFLSGIGVELDKDQITSIVDSDDLFQALEKPLYLWQVDEKFFKIGGTE